MRIKVISFLYKNEKDVLYYKKENFYDVISDYDGVFDTLGNQAVLDCIPIVKIDKGIVSITAHPNKKFIDTYKEIYNLNFKQKVIFRLTGFKFY